MLSLWHLIVMLPIYQLIGRMLYNTMNLANKTIDHNLSNFRLELGWLLMQLWIKRCLFLKQELCLFMPITSLQISAREVIPISKVHELLTKIHDILDSDVCKWVGKAAHI